MSRLLGRPWDWGIFIRVGLADMTSFDLRNLRTISRGALAAALLAAAPATLAQDAPAATEQTMQAGVPAWSIASSDLQADPAVRFGQLDNGMRYALMHHETPKGAAAIACGASAIGCLVATWMPVGAPCQASRNAAKTSAEVRLGSTAWYKAR